MERNNAQALPGRPAGSGREILTCGRKSMEKEEKESDSCEKI
ncbi:hypothetical protein NSB25_13310 [Acetatifactor muris]|uniref:Uncharacterized protein n=1 Tax=Acetatifactor muris TaxID=879566 RepID=A0A2K4ZHL9_9FIRM|nr:hypothetical protein [Acetatifactor muris]MCR2048266.1 hypothetical protein [Acetatifactor muris]SOY29970.1 hypothetical protein AMURIS_02691 [Acetatifactor muris]